MTVIKRLNYPKEKFIGVLNQFESKKSGYLEQFKSLLPIEWLKIAADRETVETALFNGQTIIAHASSSELVLDIDKLCQHLLLEKNIDVKEKTGMFSWLKDYFSGS
jgi:Flp pilus assembly CpaE family ATPase